jgi:hypothetical protein
MTDEHLEKDLTKEFPDGICIVCQYWKAYRKKIIVRDLDIKATVFRSTFQGDKVSTNSKFQCLDSTKGHTINNCYLFNKKIRLDG